ncbi:unnamed protein product [Symbiodinium natans]|uniref:Uncharacterized protein n=1 Tax=Symbiodinium natans TaxID=878477 RepID=A0A812HHE2_9DINO|nr:unnamed protein product [Symbiodinium natans]
MLGHRHQAQSVKRLSPTRLRSVLFLGLALAVLGCLTPLSQRDRARSQAPSVLWAAPGWRPSAAGDSTVILNSTYTNALGSCQVIVWRDGRIEFELYGFGTRDTTGKMLQDCRSAMAELDDSTPCTALVDMRMGVGCSPLAVPVISRFMRDVGSRIQHSAILGPRPLMALAQMIATQVHQEGVAFFIHRHDAESWCRIPKA